MVGPCRLVTCRSQHTDANGCFLFQHVAMQFSSAIFLSKTLQFSVSGLPDWDWHPYSGNSTLANFDPLAIALLDGNKTLEDL